MQSHFARQCAFVLALLVLVSLCVVDVGAQRRKKRRVRHSRPRPVITNPVITNPTTAPAGEDKIISTADESTATLDPTSEGADTLNNVTRSATKKKPGTDQEQMQQTINSLSNQVTRLTDKLSQMQEEQRSLLDMERLTRAEQRAETLRAQLRDVQAKQAELQSKMEQLEYALKPENIDRSVSLYGTTRPEEAREARRRQLDSERSRTQEQLTQLDASRVRLEQAITTADAQVDLLRQRLENTNPAPGQMQTPTTPETSPPPTETPAAKNPYPPQ